MVFKNGTKNIQIADYNDGRTIIGFHNNLKSSKKNIPVCFGLPCVNKNTKFLKIGFRGNLVLFGVVWLLISSSLVFSIWPFRSDSDWALVSTCSPEIGRNPESDRVRKKRNRNQQKKKEYRISSYSFRTLMWPYVLWPLDFQIQKRIVSAETIWGNTVDGN